MKRLYRNSEEGKIGGVCAGLGDYFNLDPVIIRLAFLLLIFAGGLIAYLVAWIIVPEKGE
jgi:phage shock protein PspC (stress-responsive transcriptional regulator)